GYWTGFGLGLGHMDGFNTCFCAGGKSNSSFLPQPGWLPTPSKPARVPITRRTILATVSFIARYGGLTNQAQRPGAREATFATATLPPGSLQRMVRRRLCVHFNLSSVAVASRPRTSASRQNE